MDQGYNYGGGSPGYGNNQWNDFAPPYQTNIPQGCDTHHMFAFQQSDALNDLGYFHPGLAANIVSNNAL